MTDKDTDNEYQEVKLYYLNNKTKFKLGFGERGVSEVILDSNIILRIIIDHICRYNVTGYRSISYSKLINQEHKVKPLAQESKVKSLAQESR